MHKMLGGIAVLGSVLLSGCSVDLDDYTADKPQFRLNQYFDQPMTAWGLLQDYSGKATRRFCVEITPSWQGGEGILDEQFYFADGERQTRKWQISVKPDGSVTGSAGDVEGTARGATVGSVFHWQYNLNLQLEDSSMTVFMDDWMYQLDNQRLMNRTYMQKFGITVAELSIFFDKSHGVNGCEDFRAVHQ